MPEKQEPTIFIRNPDPEFRQRKRKLSAKLKRDVIWEELMAKGFDCMEKEAK